MRRKQGTLVPLEVAILGVLLERGSPPAEGAHGFELARDVATDGGSRGLTAHGTLYKALARLRHAGLVTAHWEDADAALSAGRPRRRLYELTGAGQAAYEAAMSARASSHPIAARPLPA